MKRLVQYLRDFFALGIIVGSLPYNIQNGQQEDAVPVMTNFNFIISQINANVPPLIPSLGTITTFTPTVLFGGANVGMTFFHQWGWYINFGGFVFFMFDVSVNAVGSSTGQMTVGGLPITVNSANLQAGSQFGGLVICRNVNWGGGTTLPYWRPMPGTTTLEIDTVTSNVGGFTGLTQTAVGGPFILSGQGFYFT